jgi:threonyl-tRNA synthetase
VVGKEEVSKQTVNVRTRDNVVHGEMKLEALMAQLLAEREAFR